MVQTKKRIFTEIIFVMLMLLSLGACSTTKDGDVHDTKPDIETEVPKEKEEVEKEVISVLEIKESDFYTSPTSFQNEKNFRTDFNADLTFDTDDSGNLQAAIDAISLSGGGKLTIPQGNYTFSGINMKSNVHLEIDENAVIRPPLKGSDQRNYYLFSFGRETAAVKNVSITSSANKFKIDLTQVDNINVTVFSLKNVDGFLLSGFVVDDVLTDFSSIAFGITEYNGTYYWPRNGVVKNATTNNADYGYGLIQAQAATNVFFKDLSGTGGVTLRFETGEKNMNNLQKGGVRDMYAENISCTNGNAALMISPHAMHNGKVYANGITSVSCGFGIRIGGGYVAKKYDQDIGLTSGDYEEVTLLNIKATYGQNKAQLKSKHYKYMPCNLRDLVETTPINTLEEDAKSFWGPSIAGVIDTSNFPVNLIREDVNAIGFQDGFEVVDDSEIIENCN
ncbi:glycoside hydrolase family protein [Flavicella sediminum]|uniref:Iota-carrageenase A2 n=1 Tax=Flavicella sediminum TaxID=2585141 RepID=UPI00111E3124|nr:Iota-carrageenase A2 [Flavicella sediminum]